MRRNIFSSIIFATLVPAASVWAASNAAAPSAQYVNQITEQTYHIQTQADNLETYLRSGAHDRTSAAGYVQDMADSTQKLASLLERFVSQPGTTNDARQQVDKMKLAVAEMENFVGNAYRDLDSHAMALHLEDILASTENIEIRDTAIRSAAQNLTGSN
jgi:hypothetical protein